MAFENIQVAQSVTAFGTTVGPGSTTAMTFTMSLTGVAANSALLLVGSMVMKDGWPYAFATSVSGGGTWSTPVHFNCGVFEGTFNTSARQVYAIAENVSAGDKTITVSVNGVGSLTGSPSPLSVASTNGVQYRLALIEISDARGSSAIDKVVTAVVNTGTTTSLDTGALTQTDNIQIWTHGTYVSYSGVPSGFTSLMTASNPSDSIHGTVIAHRKVTSAASTTVSQTHGTAATAVGGQLIVIRAAEVTGATYRYKFLLDSTQFTSADTGLEVHVWRNGEPYTTLAERYTGLAGNATAGTLYVTGVPENVALTDTIKAKVFNTADASIGYITGTVEAV